MNNAFSFISIVLVTVIISSCVGIFGKKTNLDFIDKPVYQDRDIAYVPIQPVLDQFVRPSQVLAGFDELIYVVDQGTSEIISFDVSGKELGRIEIPGLYSIAMDRAFDILAIGRYDTIFGGTPVNLACVYRINQKNGVLYGLRFASYKPAIIYPLYGKENSATKSDEEITFTGVTCLGDNTYYIAKQGPNKPTNKFNCQGSDNDDAVLQVRPDLETGEPDKFISPLSITTANGTNSCFWTFPQSLASLVQPPQAPDISSSRSFIFTSIDPDPEYSLRVRYIEYREDQDGVQYLQKQFPNSDTSKADGFLYEANKFKKPMGVTVAGDRTNYIFVIDAGSDSLFQFNAEGYEGVNPPPFSTSKKQITASFGGTGIGLTQFNNPTSVAYYDKILYVADQGNSRVLRFKLTTDFD